MLVAHLSRSSCVNNLLRSRAMQSGAVAHGHPPARCHYNYTCTVHQRDGIYLPSTTATTTHPLIQRMSPITGVSHTDPSRGYPPTSPPTRLRVGFARRETRATWLVCWYVRSLECCHRPQATAISGRGGVVGLRGCGGKAQRTAAQPITDR